MVDLTEPIASAKKHLILLEKMLHSMDNGLLSGRTVNGQDNTEAQRTALEALAAETRNSINLMEQYMAQQ